MLRFLTLAALLTASNAHGSPQNEESGGLQRMWMGGDDFRALDPSVQHIPLDPTQSMLRPPPPHVPSSFDIFVGTTIFRDSFRCGKTLVSALKRATYPDRLHFGIVDQVLEGDATCLEQFCKEAAAEWPEKGSCPYKDRIRVDAFPASESKGCTTARHRQQKLIRDEEFCLEVDAHSAFTNGWDEKLVADWLKADNEMAILSTYPHHTHDGFLRESGDHVKPGIYPHLCRLYPYGDATMRIIGGGSIYDSKTPQLGALWGGCLSFSKCHVERNVPVDPHMPWLWDGEEFLRSAIVWTHGYDIYSPSEDGSVIYHNYTKNPIQRGWETWEDPEVQKQVITMTDNRCRLLLGVDFKGMVDTTELAKYGWGGVRSYEQYKQFSGVTLEMGREDNNSCKQLHWVPYANATEVEATVGGGWKLHATSTPALPVQQLQVQGEDPEPAIQSDVEERGDKPVVRQGAALNAKNGVGLGAEQPLGEAIAQLRQEVRSRAAADANFAYFAWCFLFGVMATLFVGLSNDSKSRAIRRQFRAVTASHVSEE